MLEIVSLFPLNISKFISSNIIFFPLKTFTTFSLTVTGRNKYKQFSVPVVIWNFDTLT